MHKDTEESREGSLESKRSSRQSPSHNEEVIPPVIPRINIPDYTEVSQPHKLSVIEEASDIVSYKVTIFSS